MSKLLLQSLTMKLGKVFFDRSAIAVAPDLLGKVLVRELNGITLSGRILEVEAYMGHEDEASHAFVGQTKRNATLFKGAGHAYVHQIHTQHCLDIVTQLGTSPSSVLIRALQPLEGITVMQHNRNKTQIADLTSGPGKLCQALQITKVLDGINVTQPGAVLYVVDDGYKPQRITTSKRIGISKAQEYEWRFYLDT